MPAMIDYRDDLGVAAQQIVNSASDSDSIDRLLPTLLDLRFRDRDARSAASLVSALAQAAQDREAEIERICNTNSQEFVTSVDSLQRVRRGTLGLTGDVLELAQAIQESTETLLAQKRALVDARGVRQNIDDAAQALRDCLEVLRLANQVHDLLGKKNHYAALRALDELQNVHLREVTRYKIAELIERSVPATQRLIADAVMTDLNTWLYRIRETSQFLGEVAFYQTEERRVRQNRRMEQDDYLGQFKLNSAIELVGDETDEFDVLSNDEVQVDFSPLFECMHIHEALGQVDRFRAEYSATRRKQKELLMPTSVKLLDEDDSSLRTLMEGMAGFAIVEKTTQQRTDGLRTNADVDELWESMCNSVITLITSALPTVENDKKLLKIKGIIALFIQTMEIWGYSVKALDRLLLTLFDRYAYLLKHKYGDDFQEIVSTDDYMPMPINSLEEYEKCVNVSWYTPEKDPAQLNFPCVLPFSQMFPLCCIDIRNFLTDIYLFSDDHFNNANVIDDTLKTDLDDLLGTKVCQALLERLSSQYPGQIVQILTNMEHFETACKELQQLLAEARSAGPSTEPIILDTTKMFTQGKQTAEKRIFELVNSKIDDLIETAEYNWSTTEPSVEPSPYMQELTRYLSNIMSSVLLGLPTEIKELIYFDALSHAASSILALPLAQEVTRITPAAVQALQRDVEYLGQFVDSLNNAILHENLDELRQTVELMASDNKEEFFEVGQGGRKYGKVDKMNGAILLEKVTQGTGALPYSPVKEENSSGGGGFQSLGERFGFTR